MPSQVPVWFERKFDFNFPVEQHPSRLHPRLKQPMRLVDHLYFVAEHDDHHLAKIWEMISR